MSDWLEKPFDELDESYSGRTYEGVEILGGVARFHRPKDWLIRRGSRRAEARFIEYVSPRQTVFSIYERLESPDDSWHVILKRYEEETESQGGQLLGKSVPFASFDSQARVYDIRRAIPAGKEPLVSFSREYVIRSEHRVVLVQIVRAREDFGDAEDELVHLMTSLRIL